MSVSLHTNKAEPPQGSAWLNLPTEVIATLVQMRPHISDGPLEDLSRSIKEQSQLNPAIIVALEQAEATEYLFMVNTMWGTDYRLSQFKPVRVVEKRKIYYFFLVAGHRRLKAVKLATIKTLYSLVHFGKSFNEAILLQYHENVHQEVPPEHVARFLGLLWRTSEQVDGKPQISKFAKQMGMTTEAVRKAIRFTSLPVSIQSLVLPTKELKKGIAYGLLCELARLQDSHIKHLRPLSEHELMMLAYSMVVQYRTVKEAASFVSQRIKHLEGQGQLPTFELTSDDIARHASRAMLTHLEDAVRAGHQHLSTVARFHSERRVGDVLSTAAVTATIQACETITRDAPAILAGLNGSMSAKRAKRALLDSLG